jgi:hypothetical protein
LFIGLSCYNVKYLLFDTFQSDAVGYPLMAAGFIAAIENRFVLTAALAVMGLQIREFLIVPPLVWTVCNRRRFVPEALILFGLIAVAVLVPRAWIHVQSSSQSLDFVNHPKWYLEIWDNMTHWRRNINYVFCILAYSLPLMLLATRERLDHAWKALSSVRFPLLCYSVPTLALAFFGGTDIPRFIGQMWVPLAFALAALLDHPSVRPREVGYAVLACVIFNRIPFPFPIWDEASMLDFYAGYHSRINIQTALRFLEIMVWAGGAVILRKVIVNKAEIQYR